jgi:hypothetical protein
MGNDKMNNLEWGLPRGTWRPTRLATWLAQAPVQFTTQLVLIVPWSVTTPSTCQ